MSLEPINIKIDDLKLFADVAFAIDSPYFIKRANEIRKKYKINGSLKNCDYLSWILKNLKGNSSKNLFKEIEDLRFEMNLTVNYHTVFVKAVFGCDIQAGDYESTYLINFQDIPKYFLEYTPKSDLYGIVLTPQSRYEDIEKVFGEYVDIMSLMKDDEDSNDIFDDYIRVKETKNTTIKMIRRCYWIRHGGVILKGAKNPKSYSETLETWRGECPDIEKHKNDEVLYDKCYHCSANDEYILQKLLPAYAKRLKRI